MEIIQKDNPGINGWFRAVEDGDIAGTITYKWLADNTIEIDHTEVDIDREGEGIGGKLVNAVVEFAKEKNAKINAVCKFAKAILSKMDNVEDLLIE